MILRCFYSRSPELLFRAFTTYVRPILDYCCSVWSPYKLSDIRLLESVQRRFTKRLTGLEHESYSKRLKILKSETMEIRRIKFDLTLYYKIIHNFVHVTTTNFFEFTKCPSTRGHSLSIYKTPYKNNRQKFLFRNRIINLWNKLGYLST